MKLFCYILLTSQLFLFCTVSNAQIPSANIKIGGDINKHSFGDVIYIYDDGFVSENMEMSIGTEIIFKQFNNFPKKPEFGIGVEYQFPRKSGLPLDNFSFLPVYGLASINIHSHKDFNVTKLVIKAGYNWFESEMADVRYAEHPPYTDNYGGGIYYSIGIDHIINKRLLLGLNLATHIGYNKRKPYYDRPELKSHTENFKYRRLTFVIGYVFQ